MLMHRKTGLIPIIHHTSNTPHGVVNWTHSNFRISSQASREEYAFEKNIILSQPKHMLWVLERTIGMRLFLYLKMKICIITSKDKIWYTEMISQCYRRYRYTKYLTVKFQIFSYLSV